MWTFNSQEAMKYDYMLWLFQPNLSKEKSTTEGSSNKVFFADTYALGLSPQTSFGRLETGLVDDNKQGPHVWQMYYLNAVSINILHSEVSWISIWQSKDIRVLSELK